jgi:hypothetical protein
MRVFNSAPAGWGFTGTIALHAVDANCCPTGVLTSQPCLPTRPFDVHVWNQPVPETFALVITFDDGDRGWPNPAVIGTDRPAAGPTGPQPCGLCYPRNRVNHSFFWGSLGAPLCPGTTFYDGVCDAQLRIDIFAACVDATEVTSWARIKELFR